MTHLRRRPESGEIPPFLGISPLYKRVGLDIKKRAVTRIRALATALTNDTLLGARHAMANAYLTPIPGTINTTRGKEAKR